MRPSLISLRRVTLALLLGAAGTVTVIAPPAYAAPTCHGRPATIVGTSGADVLRGTAGDDVIVGGGGVDQIFGGRGDDVICGGRFVARVENRDTFPSLRGGPGSDILIGSNGDESLEGGPGADLLAGRGGGDYLDGGAGIDVLEGGPGADELHGGRGADRMFGQAGADRISDYAGANRVHGGNGPDEFSSGRGDEIVDGGRGRDVASYVYLLGPDGETPHCHPVTADLALGTAVGVGFGTDTLTRVEAVWSGGGNDVLVGDSAPNTFYTGATKSWMTGCEDAAPSETVSGGGGADRIRFDTNGFEPELASGPVRVNLATQTARWRDESPRPAIVLTLASIENVTGTELHDVILGDGGPNSLNGGTGSLGDLMKGRAGADHLYGHGGRDRFYGGAGPDVLYGDRNADRMRGGLGADRLFGSGGDDRLDGGAGRNRNAGGAGTDTCTRPRRGPLALSCER